MPLRIGAFAHKTGTTAPTVRYYEEIGLLPSAHRQPRGQRIYTEQDVKRLNFIRRCRDFGFSIRQTRALIELMQEPARSCMEARNLADKHLLNVRQKMKELKALEASLAEFVKCCDSSCSGGPGSDCVILQDLANAPG